MANFGILSSFDHNVQKWNTYKGRIKQFFIANDIDSTTDAAGNKRRAIFLSALSEGTYKLLEDLAQPKELESVPYEVICELLDTHFTPKKVGFAERHNFYSATQQPGENYPQWAARLRGLTANCKFTNIEEALRDRFIMGMLPGMEKEKLYVQDLENLTLSKAVELAESLHCAKAGAAASSGAAATPASDQLFKLNSAKSESVPKKRCSVCGFTNHKSSDCRFAKYTCKKCNVKGHLRRMCGKVNFVHTVDVEESEGDDGELFHIRSAKGEPMVETVLINGVHLKFEIDSGSAVTVISEKLYESKFSNVPLLPTNKRLMTYTGDSIACVGMARLPVTYAERSHTLLVYVIRNGGPPLLGRDFISLFKLELLQPNYCIRSDIDLGKLQSRYPDVFSDRLGLFNKYEVKLCLKEDAKPVFFKARPIAFALKEKVDKEIDKLVDLGVLIPVDHSDYASPIVPVLKRNGNVRLCADYSVSINKQLVVDQYPLPTIKELFARLHGGKHFTKLDLSMAYNQFVLDEASQNITCINTHRGLYKYTRLVFGLANAPAIFQKAMENILSGLDGVLCLLDDICITGKDETEHLERLDAVLQRLQAAGLTLQRDKCEFFKDEISYLGYIINKDGLKKCPNKVKAIVEAPTPNNVTQLQSFLGLVNYYRNFVPSASTILNPLYELLKKNVKWDWSTEHAKAFERIKAVLSSDKVLAHFNPSAKVILTVDASPSGLGAILSQVDPADGQERPLSFASRTLNSAEKRYSQIQKEATAIIFGVRRFHQYLYGKSNPFVLRTDHKPLISIFAPYRGIPEVTANRLQRYAMFLSGYNYTIEYIRSADNCADFLSRASLPTPPPSPTSAYQAGAEGDLVIGECDRAAYVNFVVEGSLPVTLDKLREETEKDAILSKVKRFVINGWPPKVNDVLLKPFYLCRMQLSLENGCLMRGHKVVIPESLQHKLIHELHDSHLGIVKTKAAARARFWFPGIDSAVENMIATCDVCIQLRPSPPRAPCSPWRYPSQPFHRVHLDFLGPIFGRTYLVIVDAFSKWVEVYDMSNSTTSTAVVEKIVDFISRFGQPHTFVSDNGTAFTSHEFQNFCKLNGIVHMTSPPYHPASNGQAESFVKIIKKGIKSSINSFSNVRIARMKLLKYLFDYRNSVHSATGVSPAALVFGRQLKSRLDLINPTADKPSLSSTSTANSVCNKQFLQSKNCMGNNITQTFEPGINILYKRNINNNKFVWCKGTIIKRLGKVMYLVKDSTCSTCVRKHKDQLILYKGCPSESVTPTRDFEITLQEAALSPNSMTQTETEDVGSPSALLPASPVGREEDVDKTSGSTVARPVASDTEPSVSTAVVTSESSSNTKDEDKASSSITAASTDGGSNAADADIPPASEVTVAAPSPRLRRHPRVDYKKFFK